MKEQRVGTATFIPLDRIKAKGINEKLRMLGGTAKPVVDVIQFEPPLEKAVLYAVGNTLVCDTLEEARRLAFSGHERHKGMVLN
jgi:structural maintenance of chromosome 1